LSAGAVVVLPMDIITAKTKIRRPLARRAYKAMAWSRA